MAKTEPLKPVNILVLDDSNADIVLLKDTLITQGLSNHLFCHVSTSEAMKCLMQDDIDVLFADIRLGEGCGLYFIREAKEQGLLEGVTVIALSGVNDPAIHAEADLLGVAMWIDKPLTMHKLYYLVMKIPELFMSIVKKEKVA